MDKRNWNLIITIMSMIFVLLMPGTTALYMKNGITPPLVVALIINLAAIPVVALCLVMEIYKHKKGKRD